MWIVSSPQQWQWCNCPLSRLDWLYKMLWVSQKCGYDTVTFSIQLLTILCWWMPTRSKLCKWNSDCILKCTIVPLYMQGDSSVYNEAICPLRGTTDWRETISHFLFIFFWRNCLYSLSPHCVHTVWFKAETEAAEVQRPYGADGQTHSPLNPADISPSQSPLIDPYTVSRPHGRITIHKDNSWRMHSL